MIKTIIFTIILALTSADACWSSDNDKLFEQVRIAHRMARQSIRQFSCAYVMRQTMPIKQVLASGKYARNGNAVSIKDGNEGISTVDLLLQNGQARSVTRLWVDKRIQYGAFLESEAKMSYPGDVWLAMLIDHYDPDTSRCNYDKVLDQIEKLAKLSRVSIGGRDCILIEYQHKNKYERTIVRKVWHDIGRNYLICKFEYYEITHPNDRVIVEVVEFLEVTAGVIVPVKNDTKAYRDNEVIRHNTLELTDIQVNQRIPESIFVLPSIPLGTELQDLTRGTSGPVGPDWKGVGSTKQRITVTLPPERSDVLTGQPTASEPWTLNQYLLYGSLLMFVICMAALWLRRRRASGNTSEV